MSIPVIALFSNRGGVGKTSAAYHLAWMYADLGQRVLAADLDPQANLTAALLPEERLEQLWPIQGSTDTIYGAFQPIIKGIGDIEIPATVEIPRAEPIAESLSLVVGDLGLSAFEDELSQQWAQCLDGRERAFRIMSAFWRVLQGCAEQREARLILVDLGPNLGAINRGALIAADHLVVPLSPDLFSLRGLDNLGPTLRRWRSGWRERLDKNPAPALRLPHGSMAPLGYVVLQHGARLDRPVKACDRWIVRIPGTYRASVLGDGSDASGIAFENDPHCLGVLKHYRSLMPMAQEARKPIFHLKPADGAIGAHMEGVHAARRDFEALARKIAERAGISLR